MFTVFLEKSDTGLKRKMLLFIKETGLLKAHFAQGEEEVFFCFVFEKKKKKKGGGGGGGGSLYFLLKFELSLDSDG